VSCRVVSCRVVSCRLVSCLVGSCRVAFLSCIVVSCRVASQPEVEGVRVRYAGQYQTVVVTEFIGAPAVAVCAAPQPA
jgi:hypothetical protein